MPLTWADTEILAQALWKMHPEARPLDVPDHALRDWIAALPGFHEVGRDGDGKTLQAIRLLWYEHTQADEGDVSGSGGAG